VTIIETATRLETTDLKIRANFSCLPFQRHGILGFQSSPSGSIGLADQMAIVIGVARSDQDKVLPVKNAAIDVMRSHRVRNTAAYELGEASLLCMHILGGVLRAACFVPHA
jgi:hypothetical protein